MNRRDIEIANLKDKTVSVYFGISSMLKSCACHGHRLSFVT